MSRTFISYSLVVASAFWLASTRVWSATDSANLPKYFLRVSDRISCGSEPTGQEAFKALRQEGVRIVVSVDAASPKLSAARSEGLSYIHLPIGYSGVPEAVIAAVSQVLEERQGNIYIHCHHGKHRGPSVAAIAALLNHDFNRMQALKFLQRAGTGKEYKGLWRDINDFDGVPIGVKAMPLQEQVSVSDLASAMAEVDRNVDRLKVLFTVVDQSKNPNAHKETLHESLLLVESFREMRRLNEARQFAGGLEDMEDLAMQLRRAIASAPDLRDALWSNLQSSCVACHREQRNKASSNTVSSVH